MIRVADAIDFLSQAAPRPWVTRMLHAMLLKAELEPFFLSGRIRSEVPVSEVLGQVEGMRMTDHSSERDAAVRSELGDQVADAIQGKAWTESFVEYDEPIEPLEGYVFAGLGFIHYGEIDWTTGDMLCHLPDKKERPFHLFGEIYPELGSEYDRGEFSLEFRGMHLLLEKIEMMLPLHQIISPKEAKTTPSSSEMRRIGRPAKWDWEGAVASVASQIMTTNGLIDGHGKQARIEALLSEWFVDECGDSPATSQIRSRAQRLVEMAEKAQNSL